MLHIQVKEKSQEYVLEPTCFLNIMATLKGIKVRFLLKAYFNEKASIYFTTSKFPFIYKGKLND